MGAGCSSPAPSPPGVAPFAPDSVAPAEPSSTPPTRVEADAEPPKKKRAGEGAGAPKKGRAPGGAPTLKRKLEGNDLSMYAKVRLRALGAAYGEVAAIEGERYVVKTGAGYDSVAADELSADAKRAKTGDA